MNYKFNLRALLACIVAFALSACTGVADTRLARSAVRPPLTSLVILVDKDVIGGAFAAYRGSGRFLSGNRTGDLQDFMDNLRAGLLSEAAAAGIDADVEVVSLQSSRTLQPFFTTGKPLLTIRALSYTKLSRMLGKDDLGWNGDTSWDFSLMEKTATAAYAKTWVAGVKNENLNPALCGSYENCSRALASRVFVQMKKDGVVK
jgi:hypothetical protein